MYNASTWNTSFGSLIHKRPLKCLLYIEWVFNVWKTSERYSVYERPEGIRCIKVLGNGLLFLEALWGVLEVKRTFEGSSIYKVYLKSLGCIKVLKRFSMYRIPLRGLLCIEGSLRGLLYIKALKGSSMFRRPLKGLQYIRDLRGVFDISEISEVSTFEGSSLYKRPLSVFLIFKSQFKSLLL